MTLDEAAKQLGITVDELRALMDRFDEIEAGLLDACIAAHPAGKAVAS